MPRTPVSLPPILGEAPSADATDEQQTLTEIEPLDHASATGEIEALDILEVVDVLRASRASRVAFADRTAQLPVQSARAGHHPSSLAPLALDVTPSAPSWLTPSSPSSPSSPSLEMSPIPESTVEIARAAGIPSRASRIVVFSVSVVGLCFVAGVIGVMVGYTRPQSALTETPSLAPPSLAANHATPRVAVITGAHEEITESPILVAGKDAATPDPTPSSIPVSALAIAPAPTMAPAPARFAARPSARPSAPQTSNTSTGVIRVPAGVSGVLVDGAPHKTSGGTVAVACGRHTVKAPGQSSRLVIVPCGGSASL